MSPKLIFLENVQGFEESDSHEVLISCLIEMSYDIKQYLLTPLQFGVPNCRTRFYLIAKLSPETPSLKIKTTLDNNLPRLPGCCCKYCSTEYKLVLLINIFSESGEEITNYLECNENLNFVKDEDLYRYFRAMDVVSPKDSKTKCFTKGYSKRFTGTGSFLQCCENPIKHDDIDEKRKQFLEDDDKLFEFAKSLRIRYFSSREIANLMCYPKTYEFPPNATENQRLKFLGNSVNIMVIAHLLYWAFNPSSQNIFALSET